MPKKLEDCVAKLIAEGHTEQEAYAICKSSLHLSQAVEKTNELLSDQKKVKELCQD